MRNEARDCNKYRVALAYKTFNQISHWGLGVSAISTSKCLREAGIYSEVWPISSAAQLRARLLASRTEGIGLPNVTHVVVSAPWIATADWQMIITEFHSVEFAVVCHSNVGFLMADPNAFRLVRDALALEVANQNFHAGGNARKFCQWIQDAYADLCWYLPNLYYLDETVPVRRPPFAGDSLRIGCFGARRPLKNAISAGAAAIEMASRLRVNLEFWISGGRIEGGNGLEKSLQQMFAGVRFAKLIESPWESWPQFRQTVAHMHLLMQPSFTESFNMVTADGIAEGVASVVGDSIDWVPEDWTAYVDNVFSISQVGKRLLFDADAPGEGLRALKTHNREGLAVWIEYLRKTTPHL